MSGTSGRIWAFAGAGGKTTSIYRFAGRLREKGFRVLVTTTTHMELPDTPYFASGEGSAGAAELLRRSGYAVAGVPVRTEKDGTARIKGLPEEAFQSLCREADFILVEADGSARRPFKVPAAREPVIPAGTERIFLCEGMTAAGRRAAEACHRAELLQGVLGERRADTDEQKRRRAPGEGAGVCPYTGSGPAEQVQTAGHAAKQEAEGLTAEPGTKSRENKKEKEQEAFFCGERGTAPDRAPSGTEMQAVASPEMVLTEERMAEGIRNGYLRRFCREHPGVPVTVLLNQADTELLRARGERVRLLLEGGWLPETAAAEVLSWRTGEGTEELPWKFI